MTGDYFEMKKILMITQNFYPEIGSAANRMKNIYLELKERGYDVTVLTSEPSYPNRNLYKDLSYWDDKKVEEDIIRIQPKTRKYTRNLFRRLILYIEIAFRLILSICRDKEKYDYIFVSTPSIFIPIVGIFAKKRKKAKLILDVRDLWPDSFVGIGFFDSKIILKFAYKLERIIYHAADHIIINSKGFFAYIKEKGIPPQKISFMPNSLTEEELSMPMKKENSDVITVIYTGNIGLAQNIKKLVEVAEYLKEFKNIKFKIIGYGYKKNDISEAIEKNTLPNIQLITPKNRRDTLTEVMSADIAYVSLVEEAAFNKVLPGKIIDYMSMSKPLIASVDGYAKEVIEEAGCGMVAKDRTVAELGELIKVLVQDKKLRENLGSNGYQYAFRMLRWKKNIETLIQVLEEEDGATKSVHVCLESFHK